MKLSSFLVPVLATSVTAQIVSTFTDAHTNITYEAFSNGNVVFGVALDTNTTSTDFIGLIIGEGAGFVGVSLGGDMINSLLIATWPNSHKILSSFRETDTYMSPAVVTGLYSMTPISKGTYVNATHYSYTFLCKSCILSDGSTFSASSSFGVLGWAYSTVAPVTPASTNTTFLQHSSNGLYGVSLESARSASFGKWAKLAGLPKKTKAFSA